MTDIIKILLDHWIITIILIIGIVSLAESVSKQIRRYAVHREELAFKRELLDRGLEIDEIERVVRAKSKSSQE